MKKIFDIRHIVILLMLGVIIFLHFFVPPQIQIEEKLVYDTIPEEVPYEVEVQVPTVHRLCTQVRLGYMLCINSAAIGARSSGS